MHVLYFGSIMPPVSKWIQIITVISSLYTYQPRFLPCTEKMFGRKPSNLYHIEMLRIVVGRNAVSANQTLVVHSWNQPHNALFYHAQSGDQYCTNSLALRPHSDRAIAIAMWRPVVVWQMRKLSQLSLPPQIVISPSLSLSPISPVSWLWNKVHRLAKTPREKLSLLSPMQ